MSRPRYPKPGIYNELGEWLCAPVPFPTEANIGDGNMTIGVVFEPALRWMTQEEYEATKPPQY